MQLSKTRLSPTMQTALNQLFIAALLLTSISPLSAQSIGPYPFVNLKELPPADPDTDYGARIARTMHLLSTSTADRPNKVKILFFGQSITRQNHSRRIIEAKLRARYPHAQLEVLNTAIGGYGSDKSLMVMKHTVIPYQPDLIVFHVYDSGPETAYEDIIKTIRTRTTAELITVTHHLDTYGAEIDAKREAASQLRRDLAEKYQSESVDIRPQWQPYLDLHGLDRSDLLGDNIHHNTHGGELWGALQARHFEEQPYDATAWAKRIQVIDVAADSRDIDLEFHGIRVDAICRSGRGKAAITIDGKKPSEIRDTWAVTLPTKTPIDYRPAVNRIHLADTPIAAEKWTLTVDQCSESADTYSYSVRAEFSGEQGKGRQGEPFTTTNQVIQIQPEWFALSQAVRIKKKPIPVPFDITWEVYPTSLDEWQYDGPDTDNNPSGQVTLVQQLKPGQHRLQIRVTEGDMQIEKLLIYRPYSADLP